MYTILKLPCISIEPTIIGETTATVFITVKNTPLIFPIFFVSDMLSIKLSRFNNINGFIALWTIKIDIIQNISLAKDSENKRMKSAKTIHIIDL